MSLSPVKWGVSKNSPMKGSFDSAKNLVGRPVLQPTDGNFRAATKNKSDQIRRLIDICKVRFSLYYFVSIDAPNAVSIDAPNVSFAGYFGLYVIVQIDNTKYNPNSYSNHNSFQFSFLAIETLSFVYPLAVFHLTVPLLYLIYLSVPLLFLSVPLLYSFFNSFTLYLPN